MKNVKLAWIVIPVLLALVYSAYAGVWNHGFVFFDDQDTLVDNQTVMHGLTWRGWVWAWTSMEDANWYPLTKLSHMLCVELFGAQPGPHLLFNVSIHAANVILLWLILTKMTGAGLRSAVVASLFAVHPHHVESVAWLSERKDVLFLFFELLAIGAYVRYASRPSVLRYALVMICAMLGFMSKPMVVSLPILLLLMDVWPLGRVEGWMTGARRSSDDKTEYSRRSLIGLVIEKIPLFILSLMDCVVTMYAQKTAGAMKDLAFVPVGLRIQNSVMSYAVYLRELIWPSDLVVLVPLPKGIATWELALAIVCLAIITTLVIWFGRAKPYLIFGWCWYVISLVPVVGLVQVGAQARADRYLYLPAIGIYIAVVWLLGDGIDSRMKSKSRDGDPSRPRDIEAKSEYSEVRGWTRGYIVGFALLWLMIVGVLWIATVRQVEDWKDTETLFAHVIRRFPDSVQGTTVLASVARRNGEIERAIDLYTKVVVLDPSNASGFTNLGTLYVKLKRNDDAIRCFLAAIEKSPKNFEANYNLAAVYASTGQFSEAIKRFDQLIIDHPDRAEPVVGRASMMGSLGHWPEAEEGFRKGLLLDSTSIDGWTGLGVILLNTGRASLAVECFRNVASLQPGNQANLANLKRAIDAANRMAAPPEK